MKFRFLIIYILANILFAEKYNYSLNQRILIIFQKKLSYMNIQICIKTSPLKILDTLSFDKDGNLLYDYKSFILMITGFVKK